VKEKKNQTEAEVNREQKPAKPSPPQQALMKEKKR